MKYRLIKLVDDTDVNIWLQVKRWYGWSTFKFVYMDIMDEKFKETIDNLNNIIYNLNNVPVNNNKENKIKLW